jgi:hypothetical protein
MQTQIIRVKRRGRKPKSDVSRFPCGKVREENPESVIAVAVAHRVRDGVKYEDAVVRDERTRQVVGANPLAGFTLGRLYQRGRADDAGGISRAQYEAGCMYAQIVHQHAAIMGYSLGSPKSPGFESVGGVSLRPEPDEEVILRARRKFSDCYRALMDVGKELGVGTRVATITYDACLDRATFVSLQVDEAALGNLRAGLNALVRIFR